MNREIKRRMRRDQKRAEKQTARGAAPVPAPQRKERVKLRQFIREVQGELKRVIWPTTNEVITYSIVVVVVVTVLTGVVFLMDVGFSKGVIQLFRPTGG